MAYRYEATERFWAVSTRSVTLRKRAFDERVEDV